jgi:subfamily B ATP-binding cassette protein MsbA
LKEDGTYLTGYSKGKDGAPDTHLASHKLVGRLLRHSVRAYAGWLVLALVCMAIMAGATALTAWLMEPVVNEVFIARNTGSLWLIAGAVVATFLTKGLANYGQSAIMAFVGLRIIADNQKRLFVHLLRLDLAFFQGRPSGRLVSRFLNDINQMRVAVSNALTGVGKDCLSLVGLVAVMFVQDWQLAAIAFLVFPVAVIPIVRLGKRMRKVTANTQEELGLFTTLLNQAIQGIRLVKAYSMAEYEQNRVGAVVERLFHLTFRSARIRALSSPIMELLGGVAVAVVIVYGGYRVIGDETDAGSFFSFITALLMAYEPMKRLANLNASLQEGLAGAERLFDLLDTEPAIRQRPDARDLTVRDGAVRLENVTFAYGSDSGAALRDVSLEAAAGRTTALVGPSGAGKTTVLNLIGRFHDVDAGQVTIDTMDVRNATFESLYGSIALVSQEITLFDDSVRANIAYGRTGASEADIIAAAKGAAAHDFIIALPNGYDTMVGEQGVKLSGGQRQRLSIARAMLKNAPILLLDEATSALDTESEREVQAALADLMRGRTTLVIAHRLSTIVGADTIYVLEAGQVVEFGSHTHLMERGGTYARLYALQFSGEPANGLPPAQG